MQANCPCGKTCIYYAKDELSRVRGNNFDLLVNRYHFRCHECGKMFDTDVPERDMKCADTQYMMDDLDSSQGQSTAPSRFGT